MSDTKNSKLVPSGSRQIVARSSSLAKRGLNLANEILYQPEIINDYDTAIELNELYPGDAGAYISRWFTYIDKGNYDQAIKDFDKAIELKPEDAHAYIIYRGFACIDKGDYDQAIKDYDTAIELNPKCADAYIHRGLAYYFKGNYDQAIKDFDKAIGLSPEDAAAYYNRGRAYGMKGNAEKEKEDLKKAADLGMSGRFSP